jgi:hypothetical protein
MLLTRKQYDTLIARWPHYMAKTWPGLRKTWSLAGITVHDDVSHLAYLLRGL